MPSFPLYLLPSLRIPLRRQRTLDAPRASEPSSPSSTDVPSLSSSPISPTSPTSPLPNRRLSRAHPATLRCGSCSTDLAFRDQIISKGFHGRHGRAYLVSPPSSVSTPSCPRSPALNEVTTAWSYSTSPTDLVNVKVGKAEKRELVTGQHIVADISCVTCGTVVGWKYVDAREPEQRYKVGKFILETRRVVGSHSWEDMVVPETDEGHPDDQRDDCNDAVVFDSDDEDECDDIFAGVWDPEVVAERRRSRIASMSRFGEMS
ncbi:hypothetical protein VTI74DRAFT_5734 [Chaetomium olivicolor]